MALDPFLTFADIVNATKGRTPTSDEQALLRLAMEAMLLQLKTERLEEKRALMAWRRAHEAWEDLILSDYLRGGRE